MKSLLPITILSCLFFAGAAEACSPKKGPPLPPSGNYKNATAVFVATAVPGSAKGEGAERSVEIKVHKAFKGSPGSSARYAQARHGTCSFELKEGATYLIFAQLEKGAYSSSAFSGTGDIQQALPTLRAVLEQEKNNGVFANKTDTSDAPGAMPPNTKLKKCDNAKQGDKCYLDLLACSYVWNDKLKTECYARARTLLGKHLGADWLN
jgi:hypothetical protein